MVGALTSCIRIFLRLSSEIQLLEGVLEREVERLEGVVLCEDREEELQGPYPLPALEMQTEVLDIW